MRSVRTTVHTITGVDPEGAVTTEQAVTALDSSVSYTSRANAHRIILACYLRAARDQARESEKAVKDWLATKPFGLGRSTIYNFIDVAEAAIRRELLPADVLDLDWTDVVRRAKAALRPDAASDTPRTAEQDAAALTRSVQAFLRKLEAAPEEVRRMALTSEHGARLESMLTPKATETPDQVALTPNPNRKLRKPRDGEVPGIFPYPGGKSRSVERITEEIGKLAAGTVFCEPFVGSGVLALNMLAKGHAEEVRLNDRCEAVAAVWNAIIHEPEELKRRILRWEPTVAGYKKMLRLLKAPGATDMDLAFAKLVVVRNSYKRMGERANNPPKYIKWSDWNPHYMVCLIDEHHRLLEGRVVGGRCTSQDALEVLAEPGAKFAVLDPPYVGSGKATYSYFLDEGQHRALARALHTAEFEWLLCYDDHPLVAELYGKAFSMERIAVSQASRGRPGSTGKTLTPELRVRSWRRTLGPQAKQRLFSRKLKSTRPEKDSRAEDRLVEAVFYAIRHDGGVLHRQLSEDEFETEFEKLRMTPSSLSDGKLRPNMVGLSVTNHFHPEMLRVRCRDFRTPMDVWQDQALLKKAIRRRVRSGDNLKPWGIRKSIYSLSRTQRVSNFRPAAAKSIYDHFQPQFILDFSAGWGGRLLGAMASGVKYVGIDPNTVAIEGNRRMVETVQRITKQEFDAELVQACAEAVLGQGRWQPDLIVTSPPYFDVEQYSDEETQSYLRYPEKGLWYEEFLGKCIQGAYHDLLDGGHLVLNVNPDMAEEVERLAAEAGFRLVERWSLQMSRHQFNKRKCGPLREEPVLVFQKCLVRAGDRRVGVGAEVVQFDKAA